MLHNQDRLLAITCHLSCSPELWMHSQPWHSTQEHFRTIITDSSRVSSDSYVTSHGWIPAIMLVITDTVLHPCEKKSQWNTREWIVRADAPSYECVWEEPVLAGPDGGCHQAPSWSDTFLAHTVAILGIAVTQRGGVHPGYVPAVLGSCCSW